MSAKFVGNVGEQGGYLGLPLLLVCGAAIVTDRRRWIWVAGIGLFVAFLWSLGPAIVVAGRTIASEPLSLDHLPVLGLSLPARMAFVISLAAAVLAAVWLSRPSLPWFRLAVGAVIVGSLWPHTGQLSLPPNIVAMHVNQNFPLFAWQTPAVPAAPAALSDRPHPGQAVLVLPFAWRKPTAYWQAIGGMQFRTVGGYTPFLPLQAVGNPTIDGLLGGYPGPLAIERLRVFLRRARVDQVVTLPGTGLPWRRTVHEALRPPAPARAPLPHSISTAGADAEAPDGAADSGRVAAAWTQWDGSCACGRIAFSFPARRASTTWVSSRGFEASDPRVAVSHDGRYAAAAWIEARAGRLRIGLVRVVRDRVQHLTVRNVGQPVALSVGIDDRGRVTLAETVQHGARHVLVVQRLDIFGVAAPPEQLSGSRGDASSPIVIDDRSEAFVTWRQLDATATSIHVETAPPGRALRQAAVIRDTASVLGEPRLGAGPDGITLAWLTASGSETSTVTALSLDLRGRPLGRPVVVASDLLEGTALAVAGDGRTVVVTHASAALPKRPTSGPSRAHRGRIKEAPPNRRTPWLAGSGSRSHGCWGSRARSSPCGRERQSDPPRAARQVVAATNRVQPHRRTSARDSRRCLGPPHSGGPGGPSGHLAAARDASLSSTPSRPRRRCYAETDPDFTAAPQVRAIASAPMRWLMVAGLATVLLGAIVWDARRDQSDMHTEWAVTVAVLAGTVILALAVMSRWAFGADVY